MTLRRLARRAAATTVVAVLSAGCAVDAQADRGPDVASTAPPTTSSTKEAEPAVSPPTQSAATARTGRGAALMALAALPVKGRAPMTGYSRERFGQAWRDLDRNGCDQRNDVLRRDLRRYVLKAGTHGCLVLEGTLVSPYSGEQIAFTRGAGTSWEVQIDHVVALSDAWQKGAQRWSADQRERFANDFLELRATDGHTNASKGGSDAASWLPPRRAFRCGYVARQIAIKKAYGLWVTAAERDAMARVLERCPDQGLPRRRSADLGGGPERAVAERPAPRRGGAATYENCDAVRAAGAAPIRQGAEGFGPHLDRDGDGVACE